MKKIVTDFFHRGLIGSSFGPLVLAVLYPILQQNGVEVNLTVNQVSLGILSLWFLAFIAGGMNVIYQIERLPLTIAILIHGVVLYASYLGTYLMNGWLNWSRNQIFVFSGIFILLYLVIWVMIYFVTKKRTEQLNEILKKKQQKDETRV